jgi:methyltransferase
MVAVHAAFLLSCPLEVWLFDRPWRPGLAATMGALLACAAALRYWAIATLGERWSTRVIRLSGEPLVQAGPYRLLRHPNYLAVAVEFLALPLLHSAWATAAVFGVANGLLLRTRIRLEDSALRPAARAAGEERA